MGSLYEQIRGGNEARNLHPETSFHQQAAHAHENLQGEAAQRFNQYLATKNGRNFQAWENQALKYLEKIDAIDTKFQKIYTADLTDATSRVSRFRGALNTQGKPAVVKYNAMIWAGIVALPFVGAGILAMMERAADTAEGGTASAIEMTQLLMYLIPAAIVLAIVYPLSRKFLMNMKAVKSLRRTGLTSNASKDTISYHRSIYGFYFQDGNSQAVSDQEFVARVYGGNIDLDSAESKHFYDEAENLPGKIRDFIKNAPKTLPTSFPAFDAPKLANYKEFPKDTDAQEYLKELAHRDLKSELNA